MMNIFILTGLYPRENEPSNGIFIYHRIVNMVRKGIIIDLLLINHTDSLLVRCIKKLIKRDINENGMPLPLVGLNIIVVNISFGLVSRFLVKKLYYFWAKKIVLKYINNNDYNLIHAHRAFPEGYLAYQIHKLIGAPYIITAHGSDIHTLPLIKPKLKNSIMKALDSAEKIIFVSQQLKSSASTMGYTGKNFTVIPNGVDTCLFRPYSKLEVMKKLNISAVKNKVVGFVGSLSSVKRADSLPEIFLNIKSEIDAEFAIVGDGDLKEIIERKLKNLGIKAIFNGMILPEEVALWMNLFDVLILPSRQEGFGCVVLEAQACGCPVVGSDAGGIPETIGDGGIIVKDGEQFEERFAKAVIKILRTPVNQDDLRDRALNYDWSVIVDKEIEVYKDVINNLKLVEDDLVNID